MKLFRHTLVYALYVAVVAVLALPALAALIEFSRKDASASHLILIPFVSLALIYRDRAAIFSSVSFDGRFAAGTVLTGALLFVTGTIQQPFVAATGSLSLAIAVVALLLGAGFGAAYGRQAFRTALFPLMFLAFMVPIPAALLDGAVHVLKHGSTEAVAALFTLTGTPFHRQEYVFTLPNFVIEVADECSGIRSSIALLLTSVLAGHMFLSSAWKKSLLVAMVVPLTILKNGIRIVALSLLAIHVDPSFLTGRLHRDGGIVFFLIALVLLFPVFALLCRSEGAADRAIQAGSPAQEPGEASSNLVRS